MRKVSSKFLEAMETRRNFYSHAVFTFTDGNTLTLGESEFSVSDNGFTDGSNSSAFAVGAVISKQATFSINNDRGQYADYSFYGASIDLELRLDLDDGSTESIKIGTFHVINPETYGSTITLTAMDDVYKLDATYSTGLEYPVTLGNALVDICSTCGVTLVTSDFPNSDYSVQVKPDGITFRDYVGNIAMLAGGNAKMDEENRLYIVPYDFTSGFSVLDGGTFDTGEPRYTSGSNADGGTFEPWNEGYNHNDDDFSVIDNIHVLKDFKSGLTIDTDYVTITGVKIEADSETYQYGDDGYVLSLTNSLVEGDEENAIELIGKAIVGIRFRGFTGDNVAYPLAESMDYAYITDRGGTIYSTVLTDVDFTFFGYTTLKCAADSPLRNNADYSNASTKAEQAAKKASTKQLTKYEEATENMTKLISEGFGLYFSTETDANGAIKSYMHDKPTKEESSTVWTMTSTGLMVSKDGGTTYAVDTNGNALFNVVTAHGLNADWINTGTLTVGGSGYMGTIKILNSSGSQVGSLSTSGVKATAGEIGGFILNSTDLYRKYESANIKGCGISSSGARYAFWSGETNGKNGASGSDALFKVGNNGKLYAEQATISGAITATSGTFNGTVNASSGVFDSVTVNGSTWNNGTIAGASVNSASISSPSISGGTYSGGSLSGGSYTSGNMYGCNVPSSSALYMGSTSNSIDYSSNDQVRITAGGTAGVRIAGTGGVVMYGTVTAMSNAYVTGNFSVTGSKNRAVKTIDYGTRALAAFETALPTFSDYGKGKIGTDGNCYIKIDPVFLETTKENIPVVFLTKYGQGDIWVDEENTSCDTIVVCGTAGLAFSWEARYTQAGIDTERLAVIDTTMEEIDYSEEAVHYLETYERSLTDGGN